MPMITITIIVRGQWGNPLKNANVYIQDKAGPFNATDGILRGRTDTRGILSGKANITSAIDVIIRVRGFGFVPYEDTGTTLPGNDFTIHIVPKDDSWARDEAWHATIGKLPRHVSIDVMEAPKLCDRWRLSRRLFSMWNDGSLGAGLMWFLCGCQE